MADIPKLDLQSKDIAADKQAKLKALFPEIFTEGDKIDFDKLRLTLGDSVDANDERFGLHWAGKKECFSIIQEPSIGTLKPAKDESVNWDDTENLFIEGDNLEALKLLQKSYYGKVKMIYIDPPYNTGGEFIYPDKYQENLDTYLAYSGQIDDEGFKFSTNTETEGRYHSNWLNMMYPRLFLARNLLKDDGVIFISIDDNEADNLKKLCNEIYGEENFISQIVWQRTFATKNDAKFLSSEHEYLLLYSKNIEQFKIKDLERGEKQNARYKNPDNDPRGAWTSTDLLRMEHRENSVYTITSPTGKKWTPETGTSWRHPEKEILQLIENNEVTFGKDGSAKPRRKRFLKDVKQGIVPQTIWKHKEVGHTQEAKQELNKVFDGVRTFDTPKPIRLIERMMEISVDENDIVLDFFCGSASLGHSVLNLNKKKGKKLKFILIQLPEPSNEKSDAFKAGYKTISDIGKERIRKVIQKIELKKQSLKKELQEKENTLVELETQKAKTPKLFENGKSKDILKIESSIEELKTKIANIESTDLGFKVFKLDKSNFKVWDGSVENDVPKQIEMAINHLEPDSKEFDILFEILLKAGFELTLPIKELTLADKKVYSVEDDALLICLEDELNEDVIRAIAASPFCVLGYRL